MPLPRWLILPFLATIPAACGSSSEAGTAFSVRDSAGVEIVESNVAAWGDESRWTVDSAPVLTIGQLDGEEPYVLHGVRGMLRLKDGSVVVIDLDRELRLYDTGGRFVRAAGRRGQGPGEFGSVSGIQRCGANEIWVDTGSRLSIWGTDLTFRREFALPKSAMWPVTCFEGAGLLVRTSFGPGMETRDPNKIFVDSLAMFVVDSLGGSERPLMHVALWEYIMTMDGKFGIGFPHPFGRQTVFGAQGPWMAMSDGYSFTIRSYDVEGRLRRVTRGPEADMEITDSMVKLYAESEVEGIAKQPRERLAAIDYPMPAGYPAVTKLMADATGNLWARRFSPPGDTSNRWGVFDPDGRFLGHVALPTGLDVHDIGEDYVLGLAIDYELGIQQVRMYRLRR